MKKIIIVIIAGLILITLFGCSNTPLVGGQPTTVASRAKNIQQIVVEDMKGNTLDNANISGTVKAYNTSYLTYQYGTIQQAMGQQIITMEATPWVLRSTVQVNLTTNATGQVACNLDATTIDTIKNFSYDGMYYTINFLGNKSVVNLTISKPGYYPQVVEVTANENPILVVKLMNASSLISSGSSTVSGGAVALSAVQINRINVLYNSVKKNKGQIVPSGIGQLRFNGTNLISVAMTYSMEQSDNPSTDAQAILENGLINSFAAVQTLLTYGDYGGVYFHVTVGSNVYEYYIVNPIVTKYQGYLMTKDMVYQQSVVLFNGTRLN
ncbi:MAG: hypothetical protein NTX05_00775 [Fusobacteria bacterium]|nr:hypothetical protein [Fusobacteriota bacterium]